ncbi:hypothetical protein H0B56_17085 [Haloechinothrix sp. YIM 98757]|uniref:DUF4440 domain-containing protein n=1 Tax=Haloechinothrix aidingensis TaxID=2752311 RepID=A0A838ADK0_9PSEU|nr:hypothetical protein [Haloechinothrix aidingensis]MBA0127267.1 hypothetical protein [Haloechinothrix aidingensis]
MLVIAGCDEMPDRDGHDSDVQAPTSSELTTRTEQNDRAAVIEAYDRFWARTHEVPHEPESEWEESMAQVAVDPQLSTTLQGMRFQHEDGVTSYGHVRSRVSEVEIDADEAVVVDCQDASESGQADLDTGERKTVGVERNPIRARMERDTGDGRWKVAEITYPGGEC